MGIISALLMLCEDLLHIHLLCFGKRDEPYGVGLRKPVSERSADLIKVMYAYRQLLPLPTDGGMQLLLHLHDGLQHIIVDVHALDYSTKEVGPYIFDRLIDVDIHSGFFDIVCLHSRLNVQKRPQTSCRSFDTVKVGTVREEFDRHIVASGFGMLYIGSDHGYPISELLHRDVLSDDGAEVAVLEVDYRHETSIINPKFILSRATLCEMASHIDIQDQFQTVVGILFLYLLAYLLEHQRAILDTIINDYVQIDDLVL